MLQTRRRTETAQSEAPFVVQEATEAPAPAPAPATEAPQANEPIFAPRIAHPAVPDWTQHAVRALLGT